MRPLISASVILSSHLSFMSLSLSLSVSHLCSDFLSFPTLMSLCVCLYFLAACISLFL